MNHKQKKFAKDGKFSEEYFKTVRRLEAAINNARKNAQTAWSGWWDRVEYELNNAMTESANLSAEILPSIIYDVEKKFVEVYIMKGLDYTAWWKDNYHRGNFMRPTSLSLPLRKEERDVIYRHDMDVKEAEEALIEAKKYLQYNFIDRAKEQAEFARRMILKEVAA